MTAPCDDIYNAHGPTARFIASAPCGGFDPFAVLSDLTPFGFARLLLELADLHTRQPDGHLADQIAFLLDFASPEQRGHAAILSAELTQMLSVPARTCGHH